MAHSGPDDTPESPGGLFQAFQRSRNLGRLQRGSPSPARSPSPPRWNGLGHSPQGGRARGRGRGSERGSRSVSRERALASSASVASSRPDTETGSYCDTEGSVEWTDSASPGQFDYRPLSPYTSEDDRSTSYSRHVHAGWLDEPSVISTEGSLPSTRSRRARHSQRHRDTPPGVPALVISRPSSRLSSRPSSPSRGGGGGRVAELEAEIDQLLSARAAEAQHLWRMKRMVAIACRQRKQKGKLEVAMVAWRRHVRDGKWRRLLTAKVEAERKVVDLVQQRTALEGRYESLRRQSLQSRDQYENSLAATRERAALACGVKMLRRAMSRAFNQWASVYLRRHNAAAMILRTVQRLRQGSLARALAKWKHNMEILHHRIRDRVSNERIVKLCCQKLRMRDVTMAFARWQGLTSGCTHNRRVITRVVRRARSRGLHRSFNTWAVIVRAISIKRRRLQGLALRMLFGHVNRCLNRWSAFARTSVRRRLLLMRVGANIRLHGISRALRSWRTIARHTAMKRKRYSRVIRRMQAGQLGVAFFQWVEWMVVRARAARLSARVLNRMRAVHVAAALARWMEFVSNRARSFAIFSAVVARMGNLQVASALSAWQARTQARKRSVRVLDKALRRMRRARMAAGFFAWAEVCRVSKQNRVEEAYEEARREAQLFAMDKDQLRELVAQLEAEVMRLGSLEEYAEKAQVLEGDLETARADIVDREARVAYMEKQLSEATGGSEANEQLLAELADALEVERRGKEGLERRAEWDSMALAFKDWRLAMRNTRQTRMDAAEELAEARDRVSVLEAGMMEIAELAEAETEGARAEVTLALHFAFWRVQAARRHTQQEVKRPPVKQRVKSPPKPPPVVVESGKGPRTGSRGDLRDHVEQIKRGGMMMQFTKNKWGQTLRSTQWALLSADEKTLRWGPDKNRCCSVNDVRALEFQHTLPDFLSLVSSLEQEDVWFRLTLKDGKVVHFAASGLDQFLKWVLGLEAVCLRDGDIHTEDEAKTEAKAQREALRAYLRDSDHFGQKMATHLIG